MDFVNGKVLFNSSNAHKINATIGKNKKSLAFSTDGKTGDFMVLPGSYRSNDKIGSAKVTFIGINGYCGAKTVTFKIGSRSLLSIWKGLFNI